MSGVRRSHSSHSRASSEAPCRPPLLPSCAAGARLYPFGESVYVRLLPKLQFWLAGSNHYESSRGRLWAWTAEDEQLSLFVYAKPLKNPFNKHIDRMRMDVKICLFCASFYR